MPFGKVASKTYVFGGNSIAKGTIANLTDDQVKELARRSPPDIEPISDQEATEAVRKGARVVDLTPGKAPKPKERAENSSSSTPAPKPPAPTS